MIAVTSRRLVAVVAGLVFSCAAVAQTAAPGAAPLSPMQPVPPHGPAWWGEGRAPRSAQAVRTPWARIMVARLSCAASP